jgi:hypothetical protein
VPVVLKERAHHVSHLLFDGLSSQDIEKPPAEGIQTGDFSILFNEGRVLGKSYSSKSFSL